ncbi:MAG: glycogen debranching protein GlgX [Roseiarcus sp.]
MLKVSDANEPGISTATPAGARARYTHSEGRPHPLGPTVRADGVNFSLFSQNATGLELLLFDGEYAKQPFQTIKLDPRVHKTFGFWHVFVEGLKPGALYAYRVDGPGNLAGGHRFDKQKVAIDPYARGHSAALWNRGAACLPGDNVEKAMRSVVIDASDYDWEGDEPLNIPIKDLIIYETHVGGFTRSPTSGVESPGTFAGIVAKIPYLQNLGVNAIELLPIFSFDAASPSGKSPDGRELRNFWGYSTIGFFAPEGSYCQSPGTGSHLKDFRDMVKALHRAGIEVILDVVFNHTDEGNHLGPSMCFRLIDNSVYYYLVPDNRQYYMDFSGCGNTLNCNHPVVAKMIVECLEFWVGEMHVDGFRFDEGSILTRDESGRPVAHPPVVWAIELSDCLANTKIIAEAWDAAGAYQIGYFPGYRWAEWNGRFRDDVRNFVRGRPGMIAAIASRISGSSDIYQSSGHLPINSVNFVTCHDGFTLNDLVSYNEKHNWANGEGNNDGANDNNSWNCGAEGPTDDSRIEKFRSQQIKNFLSLMLLSQGIPMFCAGDEFRRTQGGNNNAYGQDNELSWLDWTLAEKHADVLRFFQQAVSIRRHHPRLRRGEFFTGEKNTRGVPDIGWHGTQINKPAWGDPSTRMMAVTVGGDEMHPDVHVMMNMDDWLAAFEVPQIEGIAWKRVIDTSLPSPNDIVTEGDVDKGLAVAVERSQYLVNAHSVVILVGVWMAAPQPSVDASAPAAQ